MKKNHLGIIVAALLAVSPMIAADFSSVGQINVVQAAKKKSKKVHKKKNVKKGRKVSKKAKKVYNNNPLKRPLTNVDKYVAALWNDEIGLTVDMSKYTADEINNAKPFSHKNFFFSNEACKSKFFMDLDQSANDKYSLSDIPGKNKMDKLNKLADHLGVKLTASGKHWTMSELNKIAKKKFTTKREKAWSKAYEKYDFPSWLVEVTINTKDPVVTGGIMDIRDVSTKKAEEYYHKLADTKQQAAARREYQAEAKKEAEEEKYHLVVWNPVTGEDVDLSKEYKQLVKSGVKPLDAEMQLYKKHGIPNY